MNELREKKASRAIKQASKRKYRRIDISRLRTQKGLSIDSDYKIDEIETEILNHGMLTPVTVVGPYTDGTYRIIDGGRRVNAFNLISRTEKIPCYIVGDGSTSDRDAMLMALSANKANRNATPALKMQYARLVYEEVLKDNIGEHDMSGVLAKMTNMTDRQAHKYLSVVDHGSPEVGDMVANRELSITNAYNIVNSTADKELQNEYAARIQEADHGQRKHLLDAIKATRTTSALPAENRQEASPKAETVVADGRRRKKIADAESALRYLIEQDSAEDLTTLLSLCKQMVKKFE